MTALPWLDAFLDELDPPVFEPPYRWTCEVPDCTGQPHEGNEAPHARAKQRKPAGRWKTWLLLCGRGFGKTRTGSEVKRLGLVAGCLRV